MSFKLNYGPYIWETFDERRQAHTVLAIKVSVYLISELGSRGALDAVELIQYRGWISPEVQNRLQEYMYGISEDEAIEARMQGAAKRQIENIELRGALTKFKDGEFEPHAKSICMIAEITDPGPSLDLDLMTIEPSDSRHPSD